jgi:hypothetical protein
MSQESPKTLSLLALLTLLALFSCAEMNDKHDEFLQRGETVYIGKVDSVKAFPGQERVLMQYWVSDPRAKSITIAYGVNNSSIKEVEVPEHEPSAPLETIIDHLPEGSSSFLWVTHDRNGNKSILFENIVNVYGEVYRQNLLNRRITETLLADDGVVTIRWAGSSSAEEIGIELNYTDKAGAAVTELHPDMEGKTILDNIDIAKGLQYSTLYKPVSIAIDTFRTSLTKIPLERMVNFALNKPVTASDFFNNNAKYQPSNAVDGDYATNAPQWLSNASGEHWLEIDLQDECTVNRFKTWNGSGAYNNPIDRLKLQAWMGGEWVDVADSGTGNTDPCYSADFTPVTTSKVRLYAYNQVRLYEIAVYSVITY